MPGITDLDHVRRGELTRRQRLIVLLGVGIVAVVLLYTGIYWWLMRAVEDRPRSFYHSLEIVVETLTTTGFGADSPWETPWMNLYMVWIQLTGVILGLATLRVLVIPLFERAPLNLDDRLTPKHDHLVIAEYERDSEVLLHELEELGVEYVLMESDTEEAKRLSDDGHQALNADPEEPADLRRASIEDANLLITDTGERTASVVLSALEANEELRVVSFTESNRRKAALAEVGVDRSVAPRSLIGARLAEKATTPVTVDGAAPGQEREADADGEAATDRHVDIREILIRRDSPLHGTTVADSPLDEHPDLTLVAGWFDGRLQVPPAPDTRITPNAVLVVAGPVGELDALVGEVSAVRSPRQRLHRRVLVAGLGEGGRAALETLPDDIEATTVDAEPEREPDVVGDATEPEVLEAAGIDDATALIVTVDDDATALLTIAMARSLSADVEILARVTDAEKASAAFRAGADYVLSTQRVSARLVAAEVHGERVVDFASQIRIVRVVADAFVGKEIGSLRGSPDHAWTVVGVVRGGTVLTDEGVAVEADDEVLVAGSDEAIQEFERTVG